MTSKPWWLAVLLPSLAAAQSLPAPLDETTGTVIAAPAPALAAPAPWATLDAAGRADARARYAAWRALDEAERTRVRQARARVAALPADQQQALRTRFDAMDRLYRDGWRMGPRIGAHYPGLQPMFGYLPPAQRPAALALLASLDDAQLDRLSVISRRTAPQDRDAVRAELLALAPGAREAWLRKHAGR